MRNVLLLFMFFIGTDVFAYSYYGGQTSAIDKGLYGLIIGLLFGLLIYILHLLKKSNTKSKTQTLVNKIKKSFKFNKKINLICLSMSIILIISIILFVEYNKTLRSLLCGNCWFTSPWGNNYFVIIFSMFLALIVPYIIAAVIESKISSKYISCPYCNGRVMKIAKKCKHCGEWINKK